MCLLNCRVNLELTNTETDSNESIVQMPEILIYTKDYCPFCHKAKDLLEDLDQDYKEIDLLANPQKRSEMVSMAGGKTTVPQIFINGQHIGGCDELHAMHKQNKLKPLLAE